MNSTRTDAYLERLGAERPARATTEALRDLHLRHLRAVPFENLSIHLGEPVVLKEDALLDKVVARHRGGFCYELNGAFGLLLASLGYQVRLLAGRVHGDDGLGIPYDHLALRVRTVDGGDLIADVGFGAHSHLPLEFGERGDQADPGGTFRVVEAGDGDLDVIQDGEPQYRLETRPRALPDFRVGAWWHSTAPESRFTQSLVCSRITEDGGRITLSGRTLTTTDAAGHRTVDELGTDGEVLAVYRDGFGVGLGEVPTVRGGQFG